ncbi:SLC44A2_4_5 [Acanthosepion pharaonis]|uniref:Choline transporter-like protein n=1 Tax=Acanthosepion pharaonis TaxID=158019 RepID=A0A812DIJ9_ACAPH|nr:SLC44A2_4_5 [Sepia pharaonis]
MLFKVRFVHGDPRRLVYPTDTRGNICGYGEYSDRPKLIFFDLLACSKMGHDVAKFGCPTPQESITDLVKTGKCAAYYMKSISVAHRCIPAVFNSRNFHDHLLSGNSTVALENADGIKITPHSLDEATRCFLIAVGISLFWVILLRWLAAVLIWVTLITFLGLLGFSIVSAILLGISILLLIIVAKRLCVAIELIKEASSYLASMGTPQAYSTVVSVTKDGTNILSRIPCNESTSESMEKFCDFVRYGGDNYHLGSLAFGSLIIAVVQLVRVILDYIDYKLRDSNNKVAKFMLKTVIVDKVTDLIMFLSKLMVTAAVGITAFYWAQGKIPFIPGTEIPRFNYYLAPVAIIIIGSYFIASCFFSVYEMAVDTIFLCFVIFFIFFFHSPLFLFSFFFVPFYWFSFLFPSFHSRFHSLFFVCFFVLFLSFSFFILFSVHIFVLFFILFYSFSFSFSYFSFHSIIFFFLLFLFSFFHSPSFVLFCFLFHSLLFSFFVPFCFLFSFSFFCSLSFIFFFHSLLFCFSFICSLSFVLFLSFSFMFFFLSLFCSPLVFFFVLFHFLFHSLSFIFFFLFLFCSLSFSFLFSFVFFFLVLFLSFSFFLFSFSFVLLLFSFFLSFSFFSVLFFILVYLFSFLFSYFCLHFIIFFFFPSFSFSFFASLSFIFFFCPLFFILLWFSFSSSFLCMRCMI